MQPAEQAHGRIKALRQNLKSLPNGISSKCRLIPPLWSPPRTRWLCCFHSRLLQTQEETWCRVATDEMTGRGVGRGRDVPTLSCLCSVSHPRRAPALHLLTFRDILRRVDETQNIGTIPLAEAVLSTAKPASCPLRFSCQCRRNMMLDNGVLAGRQH